MSEGFDNREFWNYRYTTNPGLGSGPGSRGVIRLQKGHLIQRLIATNAPETILDVGCGDIRVVGELEYSGLYLGIDISDVVIAMNKRLRSEWDFIATDFLEWAASNDAFSSDLVICLDVLIHQPTARDFEAFVEGLVRVTDGVGLVSGYQAPPRMAPPSHRTIYHEERTARTYFHEPLSQALARHGVQSRVIGSYRGTTTIAFSHRGDAFLRAALSFRHRDE